MATKSNNPNMRLYEAFRSPDPKAVKKFHNGKFGGDDTNPMWRIKAWTEQFGPCGEGWKVEDVKFWTEEMQTEKNGKTSVVKMAFCTLNFYYKLASGEWSAPVFGIGGNSFTQQGDEAYKGAYTDALSIAGKALGMCADIWYQNDRTSKYFQHYDENKIATPDPANAPAPAEPAPQQANNTPAPEEPVTQQLASFFTVSDDNRKKVMAAISKGEKFDDVKGKLAAAGYSFTASDWNELIAENNKANNAS